MQTTETETTATKPIAIMPFGTYEGLPLSDIRTSFIEWCLRGNCKLSGPLRRSMEEELIRRGVQPPARPSPRPAPVCRHCGPAATNRYVWYQDRLLRMHVLAMCQGCGRGLGFVPSDPPYTAEADMQAVPTTPEGLLAQLRECGVELESDGEVAEFGPGGFAAAPPEAIQASGSP
jgi:hypothetical protein